LILRYHVRNYTIPNATLPPATHTEWLLSFNTETKLQMKESTDIEMVLARNTREKSITWLRFHLLVKKETRTNLGRHQPLFQYHPSLEFANRHNPPCPI
jgi:hypothetical protein